MTFGQFCKYYFKLTAIMSAISIALTALFIGGFAIANVIDNRKNEVESKTDENQINESNEK